jgi:hypothetical protein
MPYSCNAELLALEAPATYRISVQGFLKESRSGSLGGYACHNILSLESTL